MKKLTAIVLSLLLCVGLLAGCGVTVVQYSPAAPSTDAEPTPSGEPGDTAEVAEGELALGFYMTAAYASGHSGFFQRERGCRRPGPGQRGHLRRHH